MIKQILKNRKTKMVHILILCFFTNVISIFGAGKKTIIPMDLSIIRPVIELSINDKGPYRFIFDTGASVSVIDSSLATELGLKKTGEMEVGTPGTKKPILANVVTTNKISVEDLKFDNVEMIEMNLRQMLPVDGVLSLRQFSEFLVTIDYPSKKIVLKEGSVKSGESNVIPINSGDELLSMQIKVGGEKWDTHLDTGSPGSFSFPYSLKEKLNLKAQPVESGVARSVAQEHKRWAAELNEDIKIGDIIYESPKISLSEISGDKVNIGYQVLKDLVLTIDLKNKLMKIEKGMLHENASENTEEENEYTGSYGGIRNITFDNENLFLQRDGGMKLKLVETGENNYKIEIPGGIRPRNSLPNVMFNRDQENRITGLTFIYDDGREEFVKKDE